MDNFLLIGILVIMAGLMFYTSRQNKKRQQDSQDFRKSLSVGDEVMTGSGLIGSIEKVSIEDNYVIIKSEGSKSRWLIDAITKMPESAKIDVDDIVLDAKDVVEQDMSKHIEKKPVASPAKKATTSSTAKKAPAKKPAAKKPAAKSTSTKRQNKSILDI